MEAVYMRNEDLIRYFSETSFGELAPYTFSLCCRHENSEPIKFIIARTKKFDDYKIDDLEKNTKTRPISLILLKKSFLALKLMQLKTKRKKREKAKNF